MNKLKLGVLPLVAASFMASAAMAEGMYISIGGGAAIQKKKTTTGTFNTTNPVAAYNTSVVHKRGGSAFLQVEVGALLSDFRVGAEFMHLPNGHKFDLTYTTDNETATVTKASSKISTIAGFVNAYYDIKGLSEVVIPYLTAGIGAASSKVNFNDTISKEASYSKGSFAYKVGAGIQFMLGENVALDFAYKYTDFSKINHVKSDFHAFSGAVVFKF